MWSDPDHAIALSIAASSVVVPLLVRGLSRMFPPSPAAPGELEPLRLRYRIVSRWSVGSMIAILAAALITACFVRLPNTIWLIPALFGWLVLAPVCIIALFTLPRGFGAWREYWRFYELDSRVSLRFAAPFYAILSGLAVVSTLVLLRRI
jgi:hypothetical protein